MIRAGVSLFVATVADGLNWALPLLLLLLPSLWSGTRIIFCSNNNNRTIYFTLVWSGYLCQVR